MQATSAVPMLKVPPLSVGVNVTGVTASANPYAAPQYQQVGDPQPATKNISYGGYTESMVWYMRAWYGIYAYTEFRWASATRTVIMEFIGSLLLALVVPTVASVSTSPTPALNSLTIGAAYAVTLLTIHSWRHADMLPRHCHQGLTVAEMFHQHMPIAMGLFYMGVQIGGSALAAPILSATSAVAGSIPNYTAAARPVSYWGAFALDYLVGSLAVFAFLYNVPLDRRIASNRLTAEKSSESRSVRSTSSHFALAIGVGVLFTQPNGVWALGNWVVYFGPAINVGFGVPEAGSWTIPILWGLLTGPTAWLVHLFLWNVNALTKEEYQKYEILVGSREKAVEAEAEKAEETLLAQTKQA